jgi:hypothetical protein
MDDKGEKHNIRRARVLAWILNRLRAASYTAAFGQNEATRLAYAARAHELAMMAEMFQIGQDWSIR